MEIAGTLRETVTGSDLTVVRGMSCSQAEAWDFVTDPERTALWFGSWRGDGRPGGTIHVRMKHEEGEPELPVAVIECGAPEVLRVQTPAEAGGWDLEVQIEPEADGDGSIVRLVHHLESVEGLGEIGPGWEFYLDALVAATEDAEQPNFDDYYPAMREAYLDLSR